MEERFGVESIVISWRELLVVVALILAVYIAEVMLLMRNGGGLLGRKAGRTNDIEHLQTKVAQLAGRMEAMEKQLAQMQLESLPEASPYARAIQMARQGRDAMGIAEQCGISRGEAELIISMHGIQE